MQTLLTASENLLVEDCSIWTEKRPLPVWREALVPGLISDLSAPLLCSDIEEFPHLSQARHYYKLEVTIIASTNI